MYFFCLGPLDHPSFKQITLDILILNSSKQLFYIAVTCFGHTKIPDRLQLICLEKNWCLGRPALKKMFPAVSQQISFCPKVSQQKMCPGGDQQGKCFCLEASCLYTVIETCTLYTVIVSVFLHRF